MEKQLSDAFLKQVYPGWQADHHDGKRRTREIYLDTRQRGLALVVEGSGTRTLKMIYHAGGKTEWLHLGRVGELSLKVARETVERLHAKKVLGEDPADQRRQAKEQKQNAARQPRTRTLDDLAAEFFAKSGLKSLRIYQGQYKNHIGPRLGTIPLTELTEHDFYVELQNPIVEAGQIETANNCLAIVSSILSWGVQKDYLKNNPARGVQRKKADTSNDPQHDEFSSADLRAIWDALPLMEDEWAVAIKVMMFTGQRGDEVRRMRWDDLEGEYWWQRPRDGEEANKTNKKQRVFMPQTVRDAIYTLGPKASGRVFTKMPTDRFPIRLYRAIRAESGVAKFTAHSFRHTVAARLDMLEEDEIVQAAVLNHSMPSQTAKYKRQRAPYRFDRAKREALLKLEHHLLNVVEGNTLHGPTAAECEFQPDQEHPETENVIALGRAGVAK